MRRMMQFLVMCCLAGVLQAATLTLQTAEPAIGSNDVTFLSESTNDSTNVEGVAGDPYGPDAATYVAHDRAGLGQTFTTGSTAGVYYMEGFWLRHVTYTSDPSWSDTDNSGAVLTLRVTDPAKAGTAGFAMRVETYTTTGTEPGVFAQGPGQGTGTWIYFKLDTPVLLNPSTVYGFDVTVTSGTWFFETAGLDGAASYAGGTAYTTGTAAAINSNTMNVIRDGDHKFIVDMVDSFAYLAPLNGATLVPINADLSWTILGADITEIDLYFGPENDPNLTSKPQYKKLSKAPATTLSFDPGTLAYNTTYYWRVDAYDPNDAPGATDYELITGPVWRFTTAPETPVVDPVVPVYTAVEGDGSANVVMSVTSLNVVDFQWYKVGSPDVMLTEGDDYTGTQTDTLTILGAEQADEGFYYCVGTNLAGSDSSIDAGTGEGAGRLMTRRLVNDYPLDTINVVEGSSFCPDIVGGADMALLSDDAGVDIPVLAGGVPEIGGSSLLFNNSNISDPNNAWAQMAQLDAGIVDYEDLTISTWVFWNGGSNWQRIFDFGNDTTQYMFLSPNAAGTALRFVVQNGSGEQIVQTEGSTLTTGEWVWLTVTLEGNTGRLYVNGELKATNTAVTADPLDFKPALNYIAKSQFAADPYFNGQIDNLKIYSYARTTEQIAQDYLGVKGGWVCNNELNDLAYDFDKNCLVDLADFAMFASEWLDSFRIYPEN